MEKKTNKQRKTKTKAKTNKQKKTGQNKNSDLQSVNLKIVSLKPDMIMKNVFCDYRTFRYYC